MSVPLSAAEHVKQEEENEEKVAPSSFLRMEWPETPWVRMCQLSNSWAAQDQPPTIEEKTKKIDELFATAVDDAAAYMNQTPNYLLEGALDAMQSQYSHLPDYGLCTFAESEALVQKKLEQIRNDPKGTMEFFKPSFEAWGNPAYVVAFYTAMQQKLLRPDQVVYDVSLYYTSKQFSAPVDSDDEDEDEDDQEELQAELRLAASPAATTGTVVHQDRSLCSRSCTSRMNVQEAIANKKHDKDNENDPPAKKQRIWVVTIVCCSGFDSMCSALCLIVTSLHNKRTNQCMLSVSIFLARDLCYRIASNTSLVLTC